MTVKTIDLEIQKYLPLLGLKEKKTILEVIKSFVHLKEENVTRISIEQYNVEIDKAIQQIKSGNYISLEDLEKEIEKW